jgi:hypothetical protein
VRVIVGETVTFLLRDREQVFVRVIVGETVRGGVGCLDSARFDFDLDGVRVKVPLALWRLADPVLLALAERLGLAEREGR